MWETIAKQAREGELPPNLECYAELRRGFDWDNVRAELDGLPGGGLNICHEALDRHVAAGRGEKTAIVWLGREGERIELSFAELTGRSRRFAQVLKSLGVGKGDRVFCLMPRLPEVFVAAMGALRNGSVFCPLFSAFGPDPIRQRLDRGDGRVLVTTAALYRRKVAEWRPAMASLRAVLIVGGDAPEGTVDLARAMADADPVASMEPTAPEDMALLHFTSGTTGQPKGAIHVHEAVVAHYATSRYALDLHPEDIFWCTADPGWVTGTSYGIIGPLTIGATMVVDEGDFDAERWYSILQRERVTVWYSAPTAIRMLMKSGDDLAKMRDLTRLRFLASVGEPLNPEAVVWSQRVFGRPFHDNWWQTETGGIMIANYAAENVKPGSMGLPLPGIEAGIVETAEDGAVHEVTEPMALGQLAIRPGWPSMFRGYLHDEARYAKCFRDGWYLTGDLAMRDEDGYYWFVGRADDVIKSAGHLIGPFEVESALMEHPAVAEAAVIGLPDEIAGEVVKAFVALKPGHEASDELARDIQAHARRHLGPVVAPKSIAFRTDLPRTRSGKIMRRLLKARELGLPEGDLSTLEGPAS